MLSDCIYLIYEAKLKKVKQEKQKLNIICQFLISLHYKINIYNVYLEFLKVPKK